MANWLSYNCVGCLANLLPDCALWYGNFVTLYRTCNLLSDCVLMDNRQSLVGTICRESTSCHRPVSFWWDCLVCPAIRALLQVVGLLQVRDTAVYECSWYYCLVGGCYKFNVHGHKRVVPWCIGGLLRLRGPRQSFPDSSLSEYEDVGVIRILPPGWSIVSFVCSGVVQSLQ